jgi:phosphate transport system substrate-binding protein
MKRLAAILVVVLSLLGLAAELITETLVIKGSNTFGEELAPNLIAAYRKLHPNTLVELESKGTPTGFAALLAGQTDIAAASRPAGEDELRLARSRGITMDDFIIGYYGVAIIVNDTNPARALTDTQVRDVFSGKLRNWKDLGGANSPIHVYIRDERSGAHLGFQELAMASSPYATDAKKLKGHAEIADAVGGDPLGIGYVGMNMTSRAKVMPASINGILPTVITVNDGVYPYARQLRLCVNRDKVSPSAKDFIRFVQSRAGQQLLDQVGFVRRLETPVWPPPAP